MAESAIVASNATEISVTDLSNALRRTLEDRFAYVRVRGELWALLKRALFYDLVALGQTERIANQDWFGVRSCGVFFPMCPASEIEGL